MKATTVFAIAIVLLMTLGIFGLYNLPPISEQDQTERKDAAVSEIEFDCATYQINQDYTDISLVKLKDGRWAAYYTSMKSFVESVGGHEVIHDDSCEVKQRIYTFALNDDKRKIEKIYTKTPAKSTPAPKATVQTKVERDYINDKNTIWVYIWVDNDIVHSERHQNISYERLEAKKTELVQKIAPIIQKIDQELLDKHNKQLSE